MLGMDRLNLRILAALQAECHIIDLKLAEAIAHSRASTGATPYQLRLHLGLRGAVESAEAGRGHAGVRRGSSHKHLFG